MDANVQFAQELETDGQRERLILVNDGSASMSQDDWKPSRMAGAVQASIALIQAKARRHADDEVGVVLFGAEAKALHLPVAAGPGKEELVQAVEKAEDKWADIGGCTDVTAGLEMAGRMLDGRPPVNRLTERLLGLVFGGSGSAPASAASPNSQRRVILLTDGGHNCGDDPQKIAKSLKQAGTIIDCIGIGGSPNEVDEGLLKSLASPGPDGKPRYRFIGDPGRLIQTYRHLAGRLRPL